MHYHYALTIPGIEIWTKKEVATFFLAETLSRRGILSFSLRLRAFARDQQFFKMEGIASIKSLAINET